MLMITAYEALVSSKVVYDTANEDAPTTLVSQICKIVLVEHLHSLKPMLFFAKLEVSLASITRNIPSVNILETRMRTERNTREAYLIILIES